MINYFSADLIDNNGFEEKEFVSKKLRWHGIEEICVLCYVYG